jgi:hypothetical protein
VSANYFAELPPADQRKLAEIAWKYLRLTSIPDAATALEVMALQQLESEVLEAHNAWLRKAKATVERSGREWNRETFLRYCQLRECE